VEAFESTGRIEDAARRLGLRSLDRAAAVVGFDWSPTPAAERAGRDASQGSEQDHG
jgi:integrase/recombinase XerC